MGTLPATMEPRQRLLSLLLGALSILVALLFLNSPGTADVSIFMDWIDTLARYGIVEGFTRNATVQPPLYAVIFWLIGKSAGWLHVPVPVTYKLSLLVAWLATGLCLRLWTSNGVLVWAVLLALLPNSLALGYFDIYLAPPLLISLWAARQERWLLFSIAFVIFSSIKAQGVILAPFALVYAIAVARRQNGSITVLAKLFLPVAVFGLLVGSMFGEELFLFLARATGDSFLSGNALNASWLITHWVRTLQPERFGGLQPDGTASFISFLEPSDVFLPRTFMRALFLAVYGLIVALYWRQAKSFKAFVLFSFVGFLAYFTLNTGVHENHLFYGALLSVVLFLVERRYALHALVCCVAANVNLFLFYGLTGSGPPVSRVVGIDLAVPFALLNVVFFLVCATELFATIDGVPRQSPGDSP
jgi:hypothetical protein